MEYRCVFVIARLLLNECELVLILLAPLNQGTLEVLFLLGNFFNVDVFLEHLFFQETIAVFVASVEVNGTYKGFEGIAAHETVVPSGDSTSMSNELVQA